MRTAAPLVLVLAAGFAQPAQAHFQTLHTPDLTVVAGEPYFDGAPVH